MQSPFLSLSFSSLLGECWIDLADGDFPYIFSLFGRYIVLVLYRCYQKLWSGKRHTDAASQTEPEFIYKEGNLQCKNVPKHQPEPIELPEMPKKQCMKELLKEEPLSNTQNPLHKDSSRQVNIPSQSKQLSSPKSSFSPASASSKQVSRLNGEICAEYEQPKKVNGNTERLQVAADTQIKSSELCYTKSDIEDDIALMKLKNENQVH